MVDFDAGILTALSESPRSTWREPTGMTHGVQPVTALGYTP
jgi:hypothetical protein